MLLPSTYFPRREQQTVLGPEAGPEARECGPVFHQVCVHTSASAHRSAERAVAPWSHSTGGGMSAVDVESCFHTSPVVTAEEVSLEICKSHK